MSLAAETPGSPAQLRSTIPREAENSATRYGCPEQLLNFYAKYGDDGGIETYCQQPRITGMLYTIDGSSSTLAADVGCFGYLPTGHPFRFYTYNMIPCSMVRKSFYDKHISGKSIPWVASTVLAFNAKSILPYCPNKPLIAKSVGGPNDWTKLTTVYGLGLLPFVFAGIPCLAQVLIVEDIFPHQPSFVNAGRFDVILDLMVFWGHMSETINGISLSGRAILAVEKEFSDKAAKVRIETVDDPDAGNLRVLSVWVDGCCLNNGGEPALAKAGIGIYYAPNSAFNTSLPVKQQSNNSIPGKPRSDAPPHITATSQRAELAAGIKVLKQVSTLRYTHGFIFDKANVYSDSEYLVKGINERLKGWKERNWRNALGKPVANQDFWHEIDQLLLERFRHTFPGSNSPSPTARPCRTAVSFIWIPRATNSEADHLAKAGAEMREEKGFRSGSSVSLDLPDQGAGVRSLGLVAPNLGEEEEGHPSSSTRTPAPEVKVTVFHAGVKTLGLPSGYGLICEETFAQQKKALERWL